MHKGLLGLLGAAVICTTGCEPTQSVSSKQKTGVLSPNWKYKGELGDYTVDESLSEELECCPAQRCIHLVAHDTLTTTPQDIYARDNSIDGSWDYILTTEKDFQITYQRNPDSSYRSHFHWIVMGTEKPAPEQAVIDEKLVYAQSRINDALQLINRTKKQEYLSPLP